MGSLAPVQYRLPFQYAGDPQMPGLAPWISCDDLRIAVGTGRRQLHAVLAEVIGVEQVDRSLLALHRE